MMPSGTWTIPAPAPRHTPPTEDRLLTIPEVAETCQLSEKAIRRAIDRGQLKAFKLCSRLRISQADMREWIASQRQPVLTPEHPHPSAAPTTERRRRTGAPPPAGSFRAMVPGNDHGERAG